MTSKTTEILCDEEGIAFAEWRGVSLVFDGNKPAEIRVYLPNDAEPTAVITGVPNV